MTTVTLMKTFFELLAAVLLCVGFYHEAKIVRFERKAFIYAKCFVKTCYYYFTGKEPGKAKVVELADVKPTETQVAATVHKNTRHAS